MLNELCDAFQNAVEALDPGDLAYPAELRQLVLKLARDIVVGGIESATSGEIPALCQRCTEVLAWLKAEAEDSGDRSRRYARRGALLNLLTLCDGVCRFHASRRKPADIAALRDLVGDALRPLALEC